MKNEFYFPSRDGNTEIHTIEWKPEGDVKAVVQLCHGMVEYIDRYDDFANYLADKGYYVVGNDHLGHGKSVQSRNEYGFFQEKYGNACVIGDMHTLRTRTQNKYPDVPYFILGHSMGSLLTRQYIQMYGQGISGAAIIGVVADQPMPMIKVGKGLCKLIASVKGWHYRSKLVDYMSVGHFNNSFKPARTRADWVTSDQKKLDEYVKDPLCSFTFTVNAFYHMFSGMEKIVKKESAYLIPKALPILLMAGNEDPCGNFGKGVRKVYEKYKKAGIKDIELRLYEGDRHELINETDRNQVYEDLFEWFDKHLN